MSVMKQYKDVFIAFEEGEPSYEWVTDGYRTINKLNILNDENNVFNIPDLAPEYKPQKEEMHTVNMLRDCLSGVDVGIVVFPKVNYSTMIPANAFKKDEGSDIIFVLPEGMKLYRVSREYDDYFEGYEIERWLAVAPEINLENKENLSNRITIEEVSENFNVGEELSTFTGSNVNIAVARAATANASKDRDQK